MSSIRQPTHQQIVVDDETGVGAVRRVAAKLATGLGGSQPGVARAELVGTELATNLLRHADPGGWMLLRPLPPGRIELLAVDRGPGIRDPEAALAGRAPAPKGLGCGLAAVRRASGLMDLYTEVGAGTVVLSVVDVSTATPAAAPPPRAVAGVSVGIVEPCGDGWAYVETEPGGLLAIAVADGVGHGAAASAATDVVLEEFQNGPNQPLDLIRRGNAAARGTRGAVITLCRIDPTADALCSVAVGNVSGRVLTGAGEKGLASYPGGLGLAIDPPNARPQQHPWPPGATLVVWTDGLKSRLELGRYHGLFEHDPAVVAAVLHRDHGRGTDDATVVVARRIGQP